MPFNIETIERSIGRDLRKLAEIPYSDAVLHLGDIADVSRMICRMAFVDGLLSGAKRSMLRPSGQRYKIPHTLVQFWDKETPPSDVQELMSGWEAHPEYSYVRFSDEAARQFISDNYSSSLVECYDHSHHAAMKSDIFRVAYLLKAGGIWIDADDSTTTRSLHKDFSIHAQTVVYPIIWDTKSLNFVRFTEQADRILSSIMLDDPDIAFYLNNSPVASAPGSAFMATVLEMIEANVQRARREGRRADIHLETGPATITACFCLNVLRNGFGEGTGTEMSSSYDFVIQRNWCDYKGGDGHWSRV